MPDAADEDRMWLPTPLSAASNVGADAVLRLPAFAQLASCADRVAIPGQGWLLLSAPPGSAMGVPFPVDLARVLCLRGRVCAGKHPCDACRL